MPPRPQGFACDNWRMQLSQELHEPHVPQLLGPDHRVVKMSVCILSHSGVHRHRQPEHPRPAASWPLAASLRLQLLRIADRHDFA